MKKLRIPALILSAAIILTSAAGCSNNTQKLSSSENSGSGYAAMPDVGNDQVNIDLNEGTNINSTAYQLNGVIDSGYVKDGLKYIYLDVTLRNDTDIAVEMSALSNFYLILSDGTEVLPDIRADLYAKEHINGYQQLLSIGSGDEFKGYIGFAVNQNVNAFTVGFFPTGKNGDRSNVVLCEINTNDITSAPEGMIK